ncbi:transglycosylase SLT domain-containing protein [Pseudonocardia hispaniensis]|uniref:Transglycosylase SLT domain-containing protein n=1 Tax=Pseudonocardia hispaniensis TaxID=904933 RepID=A0ABW1J4V0_9PSEU
MPVVRAPNRTTPRHRAVDRQVVVGLSPQRSIGTSTAAIGAVFGVVTTGAFAVVLPAPMNGPDVADAAEIGPAALATSAQHLPMGSGPGPVTNVGHVSPVSLVVDTADTETATSAVEALASLDKAGRLADELAQLHAQQAERARIDAIIANGGVDGWIAEALRIMELPQSLSGGVKKIIMAESGGNPKAINLWDSNARRGTPSQGLMQTIPSTYRKFVHPSLADRPITDPIANITAGVRYMIATYGINTVRAGGRSNAAGGYIGY